MENIFIAVAAHKRYWMPKEQAYKPIQVGAKGKKSFGWLRDDSGENISEKNPTFCELTAIYWAWKNVDADIYGLVHYRRYFSNGNLMIAKKKRILKTKQIAEKMLDVNVMLPKKRHYWIETNESQYIHAHHEADLITTKKVLSELCPKIEGSWDRVMNRSSGHRFNMFIMRKDTFQAYCKWLFPILEEVEKRLDISTYSTNDQRVFGFIAERLMDVWLDCSNIPYLENSIVNLENQKWGHKIISFLQCKHNGEKKK